MSTPSTNLGNILFVLKCVSSLYRKLFLYSFVKLSSCIVYCMVSRDVAKFGHFLSRGAGGVLCCTVQRFRAGKSTLPLQRIDTMYHDRFYWVTTILMLCSSFIQGCQSDFRVTSGGAILKESHEKSTYEQATDQVSEPDVQSSALSDVPNSGPTIAISATLPLVAASTVQVASPTHHLDGKSNTVPSGQQALSTGMEEIDAKPVANSTAQVARPSSVGCPASLHALQSQASTSIFGSEEWSQYFGEVGTAPPLPENMVDILNSPCPFWTGKAVKDTHLLVLLPATVDGMPFSLNLLRELVKSPKGGGHPTKYSFYEGDIQKVLGAQPPVSSYWILMTRDVLEGTRNKEYTDQKAIVATHAREMDLSYELPGTLEAATAILSHYVRSAERLYSDSPSTYTRCQESVKELFSMTCPVVVGGLSSEGLFVSSGFNGYSKFSGVASLRKF
jgi:hypothetical protein